MKRMLAFLILTLFLVKCTEEEPESFNIQIINNSSIGFWIRLYDEDRYYFWDLESGEVPVLLDEMDVGINGMNTFWNFSREMDYIVYIRANDSHEYPGGCIRGISLLGLGTDVVSAIGPSSNIPEIGDCKITIFDRKPILYTDIIYLYCHRACRIEWE